MTGSIHWHVYPDVDSMADALATALAERARQALAERGRYLIVLTGGKTPRPLYERISRIETDWSRWHVFFGDERCLPARDPGRNDTMARAAWLDHVPLPADNVRPIPAELGPERGADAYAESLRAVGTFDTTLLGLGEDGHTASLFPGQAAGLAADAPDAVPVRNAPKPPPERISLSAARLRRARDVVLLAAGPEKREAAERLARRDPEIPITRVMPDGAEAWLDAAAAEGIRSL